MRCEVNESFQYEQEKGVSDDDLTLKRNKKMK
jgi:hypothetical protein